MNKRTMVAVCLMVAALSAGSAQAADHTYLAAKAGIFLPNGKDGGDYKGLKYFDNGLNVDIVAGYRPVSYAAFELGTGFYTASGKVSNPNSTIDRTVYGVPITLTVKAVHDFDRLQVSAGAGIGIYQGFIKNRIDSPDFSPVDESAHGMAVGYQAVADIDFKISDNWSVGTNFKWFTAKPEIEMQNINSTHTGIVPTKDKWEIGGTVVNAGVKYQF